MARIQSLGHEHIYANGTAIKTNKQTNKQTNKKTSFVRAGFLGASNDHMKIMGVSGEHSLSPRSDKLPFYSSQPWDIILIFALGTRV